jgi:3-oxoacyl-[acyl-carrier protein] reductase
MTDLTNKVALITGSARGVGKAIAERYASLGARIVINYSKDEKSALETAAVIQRLGAEAITIQGDVSNVADIERLFARALEKFGKLDIVVANAGVEIIDQSILDFTEEQFDRLFSINTKGAFFTLQQAARHVADHGRIIYIGSSSTSFPRPGLALYGGSKMAPRFLVEVLAKEVGKRWIAVNSIIPTAIEGAGVFTKLASDAPFRAYVEQSRPMPRMGTVDDVANAAEYLASDLSAFVSGQHLLLSGGGPG